MFAERCETFLPVCRLYSLSFMYVVRENFIHEARSNQIDECLLWRHTKRESTVRRLSQVHARGAGTCRKVNKNQNNSPPLVCSRRSMKIYKQSVSHSFSSLRGTLYSALLPWRSIGLPMCEGKSAIFSILITVA